MRGRPHGCPTGVRAGARGECSGGCPSVLGPYAPYGRGPTDQSRPAAVGSRVVGPPPCGSAAKTPTRWWRPEVHEFARCTTFMVRDVRADERWPVTIPPLTVTRHRRSTAYLSGPGIPCSRRPLVRGDAWCFSVWCLLCGRWVVDRTGLRRFSAVRPTQPLRSAFLRRPVRISSAVFGAVCGRSFPFDVRPAPWCSPAKRVEGFSSDRFPVRGGGLLGHFVDSPVSTSRSSGGEAPDSEVLDGLKQQARSQCCRRKSCVLRFDRAWSGKYGFPVYASVNSCPRFSHRTGVVIRSIRP